ncbi:MAG: hypothetical protein K2P85_03320 [Flavobacteriaceae bacterium]|nr:hypothetical protein [Flavobacteriaceae bacterium]
MKKIIFATLVVFSITFVSCTSDALDANTDSNNISNNHNEIGSTQKPADTTGGQGGQIPPPPPPVAP